MTSIVGVLVGGTGQSGLGQRFCAVVRDHYRNAVFARSALRGATLLATKTMDDFKKTYVKLGQYGALVAFPAENAFHLCEFAVADFQPEMKTEQLWYASLGSAQTITDPFLALMRDVFWQTDLPTVHDAIFATTWTLQHAIKVNPGGVNGPVRIAVLEQQADGSCRARLLDKNDLLEHSQNIDAAKELLRQFQREHRAGDENDVPDLPSP